MKILVTGANGLVGSKFVDDCSNKYELLTPAYPEFDLTNPTLVMEYLSKNNPEVVIHFAAYTNVGEAEKQKRNEFGDCWKINVMGTKNLVENIDTTITRYIHISTDMVFSGSSDNPGPYSEAQIPNESSQKLTWYGYTKKLAEKIAKDKFGNKVTILRLIYPVRAKYDAKLDYLRKPLSLFDEGKLYPLFADQQISIAFIDEISTALQKIIDGKFFGIFHASCPNTTTPYDLISYFIEKTRGVTGVAKKASLDEFLKTVDNPVRYPKYGGLKVSQTEKVLGIRYSTWREIVDQIASQM
jgi:dTDP-4-dehydrorhamnose reductase